MEATLHAVKRESRGKNEARRLRVAGKIPAVVYGGERGVMAIAVDPKALSRLLHTESGVNTLVDLQIDGEAPAKVLVKDFLLQPVDHSLLHADFYRIAMDKKLTVSVRIDVEGEPKGVKVQGGVLEFLTRQIEVECLPADIPETITIDVSDLTIGQAVRLREVAEGQKWTPLADGDLMLVHVVAAKVVVEVVADAAPVAAAEPEVVKKGKPDKED
jgi:large subunit ribosomal protein L25